MTNVVTDDAREILVGSVACIKTPVSPVTPFRVSVAVFAAGGIIVHAFTVEPPVGSVIVFAPDASVSSSITPGLAVFDAAEIVSVPTVSTVYTIVMARVLVVAILCPKVLNE